MTYCMGIGIPRDVIAFYDTVMNLYDFKI